MWADSQRTKVSGIDLEIVVTVGTTFIGKPDQTLRTLKTPIDIRRGFRVFNNL
jgi:hypothetical protein